MVEVTCQSSERAAFNLTSSDDTENQQKMGFKDFTLREHHRLNRFSQSTISGAEV